MKISDGYKLMSPKIRECHEYAWCWYCSLKLLVNIGGGTMEEGGLFAENFMKEAFGVDDRFMKKLKEECQD